MMIFAVGENEKMAEYIFEIDGALFNEDTGEAVMKPEYRGKLVRCKDCKHRYVDGENVRYNVCELNHNKVQSDDWYCADGERKDE